MGSSHNLILKDRPSYPLRKGLIFLHGWGTSPWVWEKQVAYFSKKYKVETPTMHSSLRGVDIVDVNTEAISKKREIASSRRLAALGVAPRNDDLQNILIGWSYGGMLAMGLATKEPTKYKALVLVGSSARFADGMNPVIIKNLRRNLIRDYETTMRNCYGTFFSVEEVSFISDFVKRQGLPDKKETIELLDKLAILDLKEVLKDVNIPALIIHGDKDEICPIQSGEYLYKNIRDSRFEIIKGTGHMPFYTRPQEFNKILEGFLADID